MSLIPANVLRSQRMSAIADLMGDAARLKHSVGLAFDKKADALRILADRQQALDSTAKACAAAIAACDDIDTLAWDVLGAMQTLGSLTALRQTGDAAHDKMGAIYADFLAAK